MRYLCLHILGFKKPGITCAEYRDYMVNVHAPHVSALMDKYGVLDWSMTHVDEAAADMFDQIRDGLFTNMAPFDSCVSIVMPDLDTWVRFKVDPFFKQDVAPDHARFADTKRSQMLLGWYVPLIKDRGLLIGSAA